MFMLCVVLIKYYNVNGFSDEVERLSECLYVLVLLVGLTCTITIYVASYLFALARTSYMYLLFTINMYYFYYPYTYIHTYVPTCILSLFCGHSKTFAE